MTSNMLEESKGAALLDAHEDPESFQSDSRNETPALGNKKMLQSNACYLGAI